MNPQDFFGMTNHFNEILTEELFAQASKNDRVSFKETEKYCSLKIHDPWRDHNKFNLRIDKKYTVLDCSYGFYGEADTLDEAIKIAKKCNSVTKYIWKNNEIVGAYLYGKPAQKIKYQWFFDEKNDYLILRRYTKDDEYGEYNDEAMYLYHTTIGTGTTERGFMTRCGGTFKRATPEIIKMWKNRQNLPHYKGSAFLKYCNRCDYLYRTEYPKISNGYKY